MRLRPWGVGSLLGVLGVLSAAFGLEFASVSSDFACKICYRRTRFPSRGGFSVSELFFYLLQEVVPRGVVRHLLLYQALTGSPSHASLRRRQRSTSVVVGGARRWLRDSSLPAATTR